MRIMEIVSGPTVNGAITNCVEVTRALSEQGHEITLVCRPDSWISHELRDDVDVISSDLHRWPADELRRVGEIARQKKIEVLHTHMSRAHFFGVLLRRFTSIPCVATAHCRHIQLHWMFNDYVVAVCESTLRYHRRFNLVRRKRSGVVHNFIDDHSFHATDQKAGRKIRAELNIDPHALLIGVVGDIVKRKGLVHLVRALPEIAATIPNVHLVTVGNSNQDYFELVQSEASRLGVEDRITHAGFRGDVNKVLSTFDLLALPTLEDSLPLSVLEGMASGLPVVATTVGGLPECVISGETGLLVPPGEPKALAEAIISVLDDEKQRQQFGEASRERVRTHFSRESQSCQIEQIFQRFAA